MLKINSLSNISIISGTIVVLLSMQPWFSWNKPYIAVFEVVFLISSFLILIHRKTILSRGIYILPIFFLFIWYVWFGLYKSSKSDILEPFTLFFTQILPLFFIYNMSLDEKKHIKEYVIKSFAIILLISLFFYLLFIIGIPLQYEVLEHPINKTYNSFANYYFFIIELNFDSKEFLRFRSIFTEPGHVGMMCALYLYISEYEIKKWYNIVILAALIFSFSFAAYVLLFVGWFIYLWASYRNIKPFILMILLIVSLMFAIDTYTARSTSEGVVSTLILDRAKYDKDKGIAGNNRNDETFKIYYDQFSDKIDYLIGAGREEYVALFQSTPNSSYRSFIVQYGLIGLIIFLFLFFSFILCRPSRLAIGMFLLFLISFIQRPYWGWAAQAYMFIIAVFIFYNNTNNKTIARL